MIYVFIVETFLFVQGAGEGNFESKTFNFIFLQHHQLKLIVCGMISSCNMLKFNDMW